MARRFHVSRLEECLARGRSSLLHDEADGNAQSSRTKDPEAEAESEEYDDRRALQDDRPGEDRQTKANTARLRAHTGLRERKLTLNH
jgi:hypothetical protein